jgi:hypothetical protein
MITLEEFDRVQVLLGRKGKPRPKEHFFAFTGFIRCAECGCLYTARQSASLLKRQGGQGFLILPLHQEENHHQALKEKMLSLRSRTPGRERMEGLTILPSLESGRWKS